MATLIKSISFVNFYNYYGSFNENTYEFSPGINIISADNNMGKSKFYNGLLWILQNQVYDSDTKSLMNADDSLEKMASGKAKTEEDKFEVAVRIEFTNDDTEYTLNKHVAFRKVGSALTHNAPALDIMKTKNNEDQSVYDEKEKRNIIDNIFIPLALRPYALLQGESMDRLVDLSSKKALAQTIETLAGISDLKDICSKSEKLANMANKLFQNKDFENSKNDRDLQKLKNDRNDKTEKIKNLKALIEKAQAEIATAKDKKEELEAFIGNSTKRMEIRAELGRLEQKIKSTRERKQSLEESFTSRLFDEECPWLLMDLERELDTFDIKREKYIGELAKMNDDSGALVIMLPEGSPDTSSLERMLKTCKCEVCGQKAPKGSPAWNHIKMILDRPKKINTTRNDFGQFYGSLQKSASSYSMSIPKIHSKFKALNDDISELSEQLDELYDEQNNVLTSLNNAGGSANDSEFSDKNIVDTYNYLTSTIANKGEEIKQNERALNILEVTLNAIINKINTYSKNSETEKYENFANIMEQISDIISETKDNIYDRTISLLEKEANKKYIELTKGNFTSGGKLVFKKEHETVNVSIRDINNGEITGLGTGFQRMKQLAIVMAIISSKVGGEKKFDYPFISDAPFSEFGENFITNFFEVAPEVFNQSIIMIKELYAPNSKDLLTPLGARILKKMQSGEIPGTFYVNTIETRTDTTGLVTSHKRYK